MNTALSCRTAQIRKAQYRSPATEGRLFSPASRHSGCSSWAARFNDSRV